MEGQPPPTFSDAIDAIGTGPFQSRLLLVCGMAWLVDATEVLGLGFVLDNIAVTFQLGSFATGLVGSASSCGMLLGAVFWSVYADRRGRRGAFILSFACVFVAGLASAFAPSFVLLLIFRAIVGFGIGGSIPVTTVLLSELLPTNYRATAQCLMVGIVWAAGLITASLLGLVINRALASGQEEAMWRWFLGLAAMPGAMFVVAYMTIPESPRYLSFAGRHDEAVEVIEEIARVNGVTNVLGVELSQLTDDEARVRLNIEPSCIDLDGSDNGSDAGNIRELFQTPVLRRATIFIWMVWFFLNISYFGMTLLLPKYYKEIFADTEDFVYIFSAVLGLVMGPASFCAIWLCSEGRLGRVGTMKWSSLSTAALVLLMGLWHDNPALFLPASIMAFFGFGMSIIVNAVVTPELFTTKHRAVAVGGASFWARFGGILTPVLAEVLYDKGPIWPLVVFGPLMILAAIFTGMIPFETAGRKLDDDSSGKGRDRAPWADVQALPSPAISPVEGQRTSPTTRHRV